jgi:phosphate transport system substrate-binding protein
MKPSVIGRLSGFGLGALLLATACAPAATPSPTAAPAKPAAAAPTAPPAAAPATAAPAAAGATRPATGMPWESSGAGLIKGAFAGEARQLNGAGATFPAALYSKWFNEYQKLTGVQVNYQSIGSGGGIKSITDGTVDFGATDGPMTDEQLAAAKGGEILHIPMALGGVVATYNLPELAGQAPLKLTSETLAGIFLGEIVKWDDPKLKADNPNLALPARDIVTVHRSDGSGTTYIFVDYLSAISPKWKDTVGVATSVNWPNGLGGKGNEGVAGEVKQNPYSIGYVELIYALQNKLGVALVKNQAGKFIEPNLDTVTAAAAGIADTIQPDLRASIVNAKGDNTYPISGFTWLLVPKNIEEKDKALALTRLMWWATHDAQKFNAELGYAPLPGGIVGKGEEKIRSITSGGQSAFPGS